MKTPIEVKDIQINDRIRVEWDDGQGLVAAEFIAYSVGESMYTRANRHYLLDRPTPPVELPTEPTLGWVTIRDGETLPPQFGQWHAEPEMGMIEDDDPRHFWRIDAVTAFTPAVAVPKAALDELRAVVEKDRTDITFDIANYARSYLLTFLDAVDRENGDAS